MGGYEVNCLITRTNMFAAAVEAAGACDFVSQVGTLRNDGEGGHIYTERAQYRLKSTLWDNLDTYIKNSPLFSADKVTTPLLMVHNKLDISVPWSQAIEFYTGLRRINKTVWMLQYDDNGHEIDSDIEKADYNKRMNQFFDHYLKGKPAPKWMTQGRPASLKQIDDRFELDPDGSCGKDCVICNKIK